MKLKTCLINITIFSLMIILFSSCSNIETNTTHARNNSDMSSQPFSSKTISEQSSDIVSDNDIRHDAALYKLLVSDQTKYVIYDIKMEKTATVVLNYPQISGLDDKKLEEKVNQQIKHNIFKGDYAEYFPEHFIKNDAEFMPERDIITYDIMSATDEFISIRFEESYYGGSAATYDWIKINTVNVNVNTGELIALTNVFTINGDFVEQILDFANCISIHNEDWELFDKAMASRNCDPEANPNRSIVWDLNDSANNYIQYYLGDKTLVIYVSTIKAAGSNIIFEIPYSQLERFMK